MSRFKDITGQKFGRLTALYKLHNTTGNTKWLCICDCGNFAEVTISNLTTSHTKSCGCYQIDMAIKNGTKHGKYNTRLYKIWQGMKDRCYNKNIIAYKDYGARGIIICDAWRNNFTNFYDWAINNGYKDNLTIERVDVNGNYEPENCCWATPTQQARNRRNTKYITYHDETKPLAEWCDILNLNYDMVYDRIYQYHWSIEEALTLEVRK